LKVSNKGRGEKATIPEKNNFQKIPPKACLFLFKEKYLFLSKMG
jgi:hypothetical protein